MMNEKEITKEDVCERQSTAPTLYVNNAVLNGSTYDFILELYLKVNDKNQEQVNIAMSPQYLKNLIGLLSDGMKDYEDAFGEINLSPDSPSPIKED